MRRALTLATVGVTALGVLVALPATADAHPKRKRVAPAPVIEEDDPRWNCRVNGNRVCGVPGPGGAIVLVHHDMNGQPVRVSSR